MYSIRNGVPKVSSWRVPYGGVLKSHYRGCMCVYI